MTLTRGTDKRARARALTPRKSPAGRPSKFSPENRATVLNHLRIGGYIDDAAGLIGVTEQTVFEWISRGQAEEERRASMGRGNGKRFTAAEDKKLRRQNDDYLAFKLDVAIAQGQASASMLAVIAKVATGGVVQSLTTTTRRLPDGTEVTETVEKRAPPDWQAAAWRLERRLPKKWGREERIEMSGGLAVTDYLDSLSTALDRAADVARRRERGEVPTSGTGDAAGG